MHRCKNEYSMTYEKHTQSQEPYGHMLKQCYITYTVYHKDIKLCEVQT